MTDLQRQMITILVSDFGYEKEPLYGHFPMRHQFAWQLATDGVNPAEVAAHVASLKTMCEEQEGGWRDCWVRKDEAVVISEINDTMA